jgi:paraquat-inducible protein B
MSNKPAVVGGFILGALALAVVGILLFGGIRLFPDTARAVVFFDESIAGLNVGAPVTLNGVRIGEVKEIGVQLSTDTLKAQIPVFVEIQRKEIKWEGKELRGKADFERLVKAGLRAQLAVESLVTGQLRVDLAFHPNTPFKLVGTMPNVLEIPSIPSMLTQLRNELSQLPLSELAVTAQNALASLGRLSDHLDSQLGPLTQSAQRTLDTATQTLQTTDEAVRKLQADASIALQNLNPLLVDARRHLDERGAELSLALTASDRTLRQAEILLGGLNGLAAPRSPVRTNLEAATRDLAATASSLHNFAQTIERNPDALLLGRSSR